MNNVALRQQEVQQEETEEEKLAKARKNIIKIYKLILKRIMYLQNFTFMP